MGLWSYTQKPIYTDAEDTIASRNVGWVDETTRIKEILVCIKDLPARHDDVVSNLELEDGFNLIQEDDSLGVAHILL